MSKKEIVNFNFVENGVDFSTLPQILKEKSIEMNLETSEIERKWLIKPEIVHYLKTSDAKEIDFCIIQQGYLSINPEIRIRKDTYPTEKNMIEYFLSYKSNGDLTREEYEIRINDSDFEYLYSILQSKRNISDLIYKEFHKFRIDTFPDLKFEFSIVDHGQLSYMEIEFKSENGANEFVFPAEFKELIIKEVTNDASYKMKNYWKRTRIGISTI